MAGNSDDEESTANSVRAAVTERYDSVKGAISSAGERARQGLDSARERGVAAVNTVDEDVHSQPWKYIGGAFAAGVLLGYILGREK